MQPETDRDEEKLSLHSQQAAGSKRDRKREWDKSGCLCIYWIFSLVPPLGVWELTLLFSSGGSCTDLLIPPILCSNVDKEQWRQGEGSRDVAVCTDAHPHRFAVLVAPLHSKPQTALETVCNTHFISPALTSVL